MSDKHKFLSAPKPIADDLINDSSSMSASTSINGESIDSDCNERYVSEKIRQAPVSTSLVDSNEESENRTLRVKCGPSLNDLSDNSDKPSGSSKNAKNTASSDGPIFSITFKNQEIARKYRRRIKEFLKDLIKKHDPEAEECEVSDLELDVWEEKLPEEETDDISGLFTVDKQPAAKDDLDVPTYCQKYSGVLQKNEETPDKAKDRVSFQTCFNCLGDHCLRDCPKKRDGATIAKNRKAFMSKHGTQKSRYHLDDEQRFAHIMPGEISDALRKALGLNKHALPMHVYRMRLLGYPPGWLEEAKVSHSGITLFDDQGQEVADLEDEDGEIVAMGARDKYDLKKIISFPGFNVKPKPGTRDDHEYLRFPPMMPEQSKESLLQQLEPNSAQAYKRRRLLPTSAVKKMPDEPAQTPSDMDVEDVTEEVTLLPPDDACRFIPPLPKDTPPRPPPPPSTESDSEGGETRSQEPSSPLSTHSVVVQGQCSMSSPRAQSPSLSDLESRKRQLLAELEDGGSSSDATQQKGTLGRVKSVALGTPLLKSTSPYSNLPRSEKFSKDVCDIINFENLPDATGKYEQMSGIIKKVRTEVARIQTDNDK